jgi:GTP cyclohydrolase I
MTPLSCKDYPFFHIPLGCEKEVSTLQANCAAHLLCQEELVKICFPSIIKECTTVSSITRICLLKSHRSHFQERVLEAFILGLVTMF